MKSKRWNQNAERDERTAPLCGIGLGRMQSKAEMRSLATKSRCSPRSKISRTLPLAILGMPGSSIWRRSIRLKVRLCAKGREFPSQSFHREADDVAERSLETGDHLTAIILRS